MQKNHCDVSVIIVNYNHKNQLARCLRSVLATAKKIRLQIIVVDNNSQDDSMKFVKKNFPQVERIINTENRYYTAGNNQGLQIANGEFFLILTNDTFIHKNMIEDMIAFFRTHPNCALASCKHMDINGNLLPTCHHYHHPLLQLCELMPFMSMRSLPALAHFRYRDWDRTTTRQVDTVPGACLFGRTKLLSTVGLLDEKLVQYFSDADYCLRVGRAGYEIYHVATNAITHDISSTHSQVAKSVIRTRSYVDMLFYYRKHFGFMWSIPIYIVTRVNLFVYALYDFIH